MESRVDNYVYTLCVLQLREMRNRLTKRTNKGFSAAETVAQLKIAHHLFGLAAAAVVKQKMPWAISNDLVMIVQDIEDVMQWNAE